MRDRLQPGQLDEAVGIHGVERFLGDEAIRAGLEVRAADAEPTGKRVLVVGAGPSGLSAAYHLARRGHAVTIREAGPMAGGMMRFGIPRYRLPRDVLDARDRSGSSSSASRSNATRRSPASSTTMRDGHFDAAFLAVGAHIGKRAYIPAGEAAHILDAVTLLRGMEGEEQPLLGRRVVVYGGGNTAMDAARTAQAARRERGDHRLPAHARARCPRTTSRCRRRSTRAC